jgi:preprotein translocase subunit Sec61beta
MSRDDGRIRLPSSTAGITQYWDDVKTKVELSPQMVLVLAVLIIAIEIFLQIYGKGIFGLG